MLPLLIDLAGWKVVVFGGGPVGSRKANYLAEEADVTVVSRDFSDDLDARVNRVKGEIGPLMEEWVKRSDIVIAATDDHALNEQISELADRLGKPWNRADGVSSLMIPSVVRRRNYVVALSTMGRSPAVSKYLRLKLERELGPEVESMIDLQEELRAEAKLSIADQRERERRLWSVLEDPEIWSRLMTDRGAAARMARERMVRLDGHRA